MINVSIPQIPIHAKYFEGGLSFDFTFFFQLGIGHFGNLNSKNMDYGQRHEFVNSLLREIYIDHELDRVMRTEKYFYHPDLKYFRVKNLTETVIYWLRKTIDDLIGITHYIAGISYNGGNIPKLVASIGEYFQCKQKGTDPYFTSLIEKHDDFLRNMLDASNGYKHSFIQYEANGVFNSNEPNVTVLHLKYNDLSKDPKYVDIPLKQFIEQYSEFYTDMLNVNKQCSEKMLADLQQQQQQQQQP